MRAKRYETLGCFFNGTPAEIAADNADKFLGLGNYPSDYDLMLCHAFDTSAAFDAVALHHLGYELTRPVEYFLEGGFDVTIDYFFGDWWKADDGSCQCLDKTREDRTLVWIGQIVKRLHVVGYRYWSMVTASDIPLDCQIGGGLSLPHANGVVIHPKSSIGPNCLIFQQVTIVKGVFIGGHVDIGAGAKIIRPVKVGDHAIIGANAVVLNDIPDYGIAVGVPARLVTKGK